MVKKKRSGELSRTPVPFEMTLMLPKMGPQTLLVTHADDLGPLSGTTRAER